jgi:EmrB/QacA subfamily drug resistance transporter
MFSAAQQSPYERRWKILAVLSLSLIIIGLDNTVLNVALPTLQAHFDAGASTLEWMVDAYLLVFACLLLTMGTIGDRFGRKPPLQAGLAIFGAGSAAGAMSQTAHQLIGFRALMGVGGALIMPATLSIITNVFPREERGRAIGVWAGMAAAGIGLGPLAGGLLLHYFSWSSVFWLNVPIAGAALVAGALIVPNSRDPHPAGFDFVGVVLSIAGLFALVYGIIEAPSDGWLNPVIDVFLIAGVAILAMFVLWERRTTSPMMPMGLFRNPRFSVAGLAISGASFTLMGATFLLTQYLQLAHGYTALGAGAAMVPLAIGLMAGAGTSHHRVERFGTTRVVASGLMGLAAVLCFSLLWTPHMAYWAIGLTVFAMAFSMGSVLAPATDSVMGSVDEAKAGVASAMNDVTRQVAGALGVAVIGSITQTIYAHRAGGELPQLPPAAHAAADSSVGAAHVVAAQLPAPLSNAVITASGSAFTDAVGISLTIAAAVSIIVGGVVLRRLPAHHLEVVPEPAVAETVAVAA